MAEACDGCFQAQKSSGVCFKKKHAVTREVSQRGTVICFVSGMKLPYGFDNFFKYSPTLLTFCTDF